MDHGAVAHARHSGSRWLVKTTSLIIISVATGWVAVSLPLPYVGLIAALMVLPLLRSRSLLGAGVLSIACLGLLRRLLSPGRVDYDPLLILPILLFLLAVLVSQGRPTIFRRPAHFALMCLVILPLLSQAFAGDYSAAALYAAGSESFAFGLILAAATGAVPNIWPAICRAAVPFGLVAALYGVIQFYLLPYWDSRWMVSSQLASIGQPQPGLVRVFGMSEAPGPYALLIGGALVVALVSAIVARTGQRRLVFLGAGAPLVFVLLLTGVRTALVALVIAIIYASVRAGVRRGAVVLAVTMVGTLALLGQVLGLGASQESSILTQDRYSVATLGTDHSFQARLALLGQIVPGLSHPVGIGATVGGRIESFDNVFIDVLVRFGPLALAALLVLVIATFRQILLGSAGSHEVLILKTVCIYFMVMALAGNPFATTTGLLVALSLGYLLGLQEAPRALATRRINDSPHHDPERERELPQS